MRVLKEVILNCYKQMIAKAVLLGNASLSNIGYGKGGGTVLSEVNHRQPVPAGPVQYGVVATSPPYTCDSRSSRVSWLTAYRVRPLLSADHY